MSRNLCCNAVKCSYNLDYLCTAEKIKVAGSNARSSDSTDCSTFTQKNIGSSLLNAADIGSTDFIDSAFKSNEGRMSPQIYCDAAQCKYNEDKICNADNVQIVGQSAERMQSTECETFTRT